MEKSNNRRTFIKQAGVLTLASIGAAHVTTSATARLNGKDDERLTTVLFQGDSITDGGRSYDHDWNHIMGQSYPYLISGRLWFDHPHQNLQFLNRGISGNTIHDLQTRWQADALDLKPDILSILVGVNDVYHIIHGKDAEPHEKFVSTFEALLDQTIAALPQIKIVLCEPFILPVGQVNQNLDLWQNEIYKKQDAVQLLAKKYHTAYLPLQHLFTDACKKAPASHWIWDGIHPMPAGHELIAREWVRVVKKEFQFPG